MKTAETYHKGRKLLAALLMGAAMQASAQSVQQGVTLEYQGRDAKTVLGGVSIAATNAGAVMSDGDGRFELRFRTLREGDQIQFRRIEMNGYEVMNTEALEVARVARSSGDADASLLPVVMVRHQVLQQLRDGYRSVAAQRYQKQLAEATAEADRLRQQSQLDEAEYNARMDALEEEYEEKLSRLETYIDKFARIDLSALDEAEQEVIELVQRGDLDAALALYDRQDLAKRLRQSREEQRQLTEARQQIASAEQQKATEIERLRQSIDRQITLLRMAGGDENLQKVYRITHEAYLADTTDWEARRKYALVMQEQGDTNEAIGLLQRGIDSTDDDYARGMMYLDMMDNYWLAEESAACYDMANRAESLLYPLSATNYTILTRALPAYATCQLIELMDNGEDKDCKAVIDKVRSGWNPDTLDHRSLNSYSMLLPYMSDYYSKQLDHRQSLWCADESIVLGERMYAMNPAVSDLFQTYAMACSTYATEGRRQQALNAARRSLSLLEEKLSKANKLRTALAATVCLQQLSEAMAGLGEYAMADSVMQLEQRHQIFAMREQKYQGSLIVYSGLYRIFTVPTLLHQGKTAEATQTAEAAFAFLEDSETGLDAYLKPATLGRIRLAERRYDEARQYLSQAIDTCLELHALDNDPWMADNVCRYALLLAEAERAAGNRKAATKALRQAQKMAVFEGDRQLIKEFQSK